MDSGSGAPSTLVLITRFAIVVASGQAVESGINEAGERHVFRHNPYHYPHSYLARCLSDLGPQQRLGVRAFGNYRPHSHRRHHLGPAGQALTAFSEARRSDAHCQVCLAEVSLPL